MSTRCCSCWLGPDEESASPNEYDGVTFSRPSGPRTGLGTLNPWLRMQLTVAAIAISYLLKVTYLSASNVRSSGVMFLRSVAAVPSWLGVRFDHMRLWCTPGRRLRA